MSYISDQSIVKTIIWELILTVLMLFLTLHSFLCFLDLPMLNPFSDLFFPLHMDRCFALSVLHCIQACSTAQSINSGVHLQAKHRDTTPLKCEEFKTCKHPEIIKIILV